MLGLGIGVYPSPRPIITAADIAAMGPLAMYDVSDLSSLFVAQTPSAQDTTGGHPSVTRTTSIGVILDKAQMGGKTAAAFLAAQPNLLPNGDFASSDVSAWAPINNGGISWNNGRLRVTRVDGSSSPAARYLVSGLTVGKTYFISGDIVAKTGSFIGRLYATNSPLMDTLTVPFHGESVFTCINASTNVIIAIPGLSGEIGDYVEVDNIRLVEVPGNHAVAPSDNARPVLAQYQGRNVASFDGVDDTLVFTPPTPVANGTYFGAAFQTTDPTGTIFTVAGGVNGTIWASTQPANNVGQEFSIDGGPLLPVTFTRADYYAAITGSAHHVIEIPGYLGYGNDTSYLTFFYNEAFPASRAAVNFAGMAIFPTGKTDAERQRIRRWLASISGAITQ